MRFKMHVGSWQSAVRISHNFSIQSPAKPYTKGMFPAILASLSLLVQESSDENQRELYRQWSSMMLILILLGVIVITCAAFLVTRRRARRRMEGKKKPNAEIADAWTESGKRFDGSIVEITDEED